MRRYRTNGSARSLTIRSRDLRRIIRFTGREKMWSSTRRFQSLNDYKIRLIVSIEKKIFFEKNPEQGVVFAAWRMK